MSGETIIELNKNRWLPDQNQLPKIVSGLAFRDEPKLRWKKNPPFDSHRRRKSCIAHARPPKNSSWTAIVISRNSSILK
jgi:hypothetical protein